MEDYDYDALGGDLCITGGGGELDWFRAEPTRWINQAIDC